MKIAGLQDCRIAARQKNFVKSLLQSNSSAILQCTIILLVIAMVVYANWPDRRRSGRLTAAPPIGLPGAPVSSGEGLERRVREMEARLAAQPDDAGAAVLLADALLRQTRVVANPGLAVRAERVLEQVLQEYPGDYDASRMLAQVYLSQHRFREAIAAGRRNRNARPLDPANYGVIGDAHLELGQYDEAFDATASHAFPGHPFAVSGYARVIDAEGDVAGALTLMRELAARAPTPDIYAHVGDLLERQQRHTEARAAYAAAEAAWRSDAPEPKNLARFLADRGVKIDEAVRIAERGSGDHPLRRPLSCPRCRASRQHRGTAR
jgi:tetratricopeptide (TPR) repeat protein